MLAQAMVARSLALDQQTVRVIGALGAAGIPALLLKGPSIACWLYKDGAPRPYVDSDILVPPSSFESAGLVLSQLGYSTHSWRPRHNRPSHADSWMAPDAPGAVDLHRSIRSVGRPDSVFDVASRGQCSMTIAGATVAIASPGFRALHLTLHVDRSATGMGKPAEDLRRGIVQLDRAVWDHARQLACELDAEREMALGLSMVDGGCDLADALGISVGRPPMAHILRAEGAGTAAAGIAAMVEASSWRVRTELALGRLFPPRDYLLAVYAPSPPARMRLPRAFLNRIVRVSTLALPSALSYVRARRRWRA